MARIIPIQFFFCILSCAPAGPPFPVPDAPPLPGRIAPLWIVHTDQNFYQNAQKSELEFEPCSGRTCFRLRFAGINSAGALRVRSYEGRAFWKGFIELRPDRCYEFGKRDARDRLVPIEGWDCDHMVLQLIENENLLTSAPAKETLYADWLGTIQAVPMPAGYFSGQILRSGEEVIVFGANAGKRLRDGQTLEAWQIDDSPLGRTRKPDERAGELRVIERPGDFVVASWIGPATGANVVVRREALPAKSLFD